MFISSPIWKMHTLRCNRGLEKQQGWSELLYALLLLFSLPACLQALSALYTEKHREGRVKWSGHGAKQSWDKMYSLNITTTTQRRWKWPGWVRKRGNRRQIQRSRLAFYSDSLNWEEGFLWWLCGFFNVCALSFTRRLQGSQEVKYTGINSDTISSDR